MIRTFELHRQTIMEVTEETQPLARRLAHSTWIDAHEPDEDE